MLETWPDSHGCPILDLSRVQGNRMIGALAKSKEIFFYKGFIKVPFYMRNHRFGATVNLTVSVLRHGEEKPWSNGYIYVEHEELSPWWLLQLSSGPFEPLCSVLGNMAFPKWSSALHPLYHSHNPSAHTHVVHLSTQTASLPMLRCLPLWAFKINS